MRCQTVPVCCAAAVVRLCCAAPHADQPLVKPGLTWSVKRGSASRGCFARLRPAKDIVEPRRLLPAKLTWRAACSRAAAVAAAAPVLLPLLLSGPPLQLLLCTRLTNMLRRRDSFLPLRPNVPACSATYRRSVDWRRCCDCWKGVPPPAAAAAACPCPCPCCSCPWGSFNPCGIPVGTDARPRLAVVLERSSAESCRV